jgi:hypothetical protein
MELAGIKEAAVIAPLAANTLRRETPLGVPGLSIANSSLSLNWRFGNPSRIQWRHDLAVPAQRRLTLAPEIAQAMVFGYRRIRPTSDPERARTF